MSIDSLIERLAADLKPVCSRRPWRDAGLLAILGTVEVVLFVALGQMRPDMHVAMTLPGFWWKLASLALLTAMALTTALKSFNPVDSPRPGLRRFAWVVIAALALGWLIDAANAGKVGLPDRLMWRLGVECVVAMVVLSIPPLIALAMLMRRGAPTDQKGSSLAVGVASAAWGALVFVLNCPQDDPFYIAVWYPVGCGLVALAARLVLPRFTRW